jgi:phospholipase/lecithinase/hemolysin
VIKRWVLGFGALALGAATPASAVRDTAYYSSLTVFGDSLVDAGNLYLSNGGTRPDPTLGYYQNRFTNGYDYTDLLSLDLFGTPTKPSLQGGNNYAYGGGRIVDTGDVIPDLTKQLDTFAASGSVIDPNGLYVMNFGANDVFGAKGVFGPVGAIGNYPDVSSYLKAAAEQYAAGIQRLNDMGVRNILMTDFPLFGDPYTTEANSYLAAALAGLSLDSDTTFMFYSLSDFNRRVLTNPASFGLPQMNTSVSCIQANAQATNCEGYFSFDGIHPVAAVQAAGYADINRLFGLNVAQAVPEPMTWVMMVTGFGAIGATMRYRRRRTTIAYS